MKKLINEFRYYKKIKLSNLGRNFGWYIEFNGQTIGELEQIQEKIYRNTYKLINYDIEYVEEMKTDLFWHKNYDNIYYRNRIFKEHITQGIGPGIDIAKDENILLNYRLLHVIPNKNNIKSKIINFIVFLLC